MNGLLEVIVHKPSVDLLKGGPESGNGKVAEENEICMAESHGFSSGRHSVEVNPLNTMNDYMTKIGLSTCSILPD